MIRSATPADAVAIARIYDHYVRHTVVSFETEPPGPGAMARRIRQVVDGGLPWLVAEVEGAVRGYAYATRWRARPAYRFAAESTVYLDPGFSRRGLGTALYERLFAELRRVGMHTVIGGIALPNEASVALHEKMGMTRVAHFPEVGRKFDAWVDVAYWQCVL